MPNETTIPNARGFVRSLNILLKFARLYGLEHARSSAQLDTAWQELRAAVDAAGQAGLLLGTSGSQLLLDGVPLESTPAERSFADLLSAAGVASICFMASVDREEFLAFIRAFTETGAKVGPLSERLEAQFGQKTSTGIRVNEIRFVAEDSSFSDARVAAQLTVKTLGADAERIQDWFRSPEKMIQLIAAAEGSHGGPGGPGVGGFGPGSGSGSSGIGAGDGATTSGSFYTSGIGSRLPSGDEPVSVLNALSNVGTGGSYAGAGASGSGGGEAGNKGQAAPLEEGDIQGLLKFLAQLGEAQSLKNPQLDATVWQQKLAALAPNAQFSLRQALAGVAASAPSSKLDEAALLRLAEDLAIRFALDRFQRGEVRVNAVRQLLDRMNHELDTLRKLLKSREEKLAHAGLSVESHADVLDRQFWAAVPDSGKRSVLLSPDAYCIPPRNVQAYVEELLSRGEADTAGDILLHYANCVRNKDAEARKKAAIGLGQLAELYSRAASQRLQDALSQIGQQMMEEKDAELQTLLSAAFVRLSQESAARRYYRAMQQALDSLNKLEGVRPSWAQSLRPRIGVENRVPEFVEEALTAEALPEGLIDVLVRVPQVAGEHLSARLARSARRTEREGIVQLAKAVGPYCLKYLKDTVRDEQHAKAAAAIGLLSRLDPGTVAESLKTRLANSPRSFHDAVIRQLSVAGAPERGKILADSIDLLDPLALPLAIDEIGMCGDPATATKLLRIAEGEIIPQSSEYLRVKAIEALGRMRAPSAAGHLRRFLEARKTFGWVYPDEIRVAAAQALMKIDPEWMEEYLPQSGIDEGTLSLVPLDPIPDRDFVRHRRYRRIRLPRQVPAVISSPRGKYNSAISVLSLDGGLLSGDIQLPVGSEATLKIPAGLRSISMQAVVRFVRSQQAGFETVGMGIEDRAKLRRLLVSLTSSPHGGSDLSD
ncbi:MAG TPA: PilZ domain-containing protein [Candidatus Acidoferrum sp.]|nr:PilZ domain-containing protein [Candidatus Acidoferrum sp.]